jgi:hypothetical protein
MITATGYDIQILSGLDSADPKQSKRNALSLIAERQVIADQLAQNHGRGCVRMNMGALMPVASRGGNAS